MTAYQRRRRQHLSLLCAIALALAVVGACATRGWAQGQHAPRQHHTRHALPAFPAVSPAQHCWQEKPGFEAPPAGSPDWLEAQACVRKALRAARKEQGR